MGHHLVAMEDWMRGTPMTFHRFHADLRKGIHDGDFSVRKIKTISPRKHMIRGFRWNLMGRNSILLSWIFMMVDVMAFPFTSSNLITINHPKSWSLIGIQYLMYLLVI